MLSRLLFVVAALLVSVSNASLLSNGEYAASFSSWMSSGHRTYTADELMSKFAVFKANHYYVSRHNEEFKAGRKTFELEMNNNADLTLVEYRKKLGLRSVRASSATVSSAALGMSLHGNNTLTASNCEVKALDASSGEVKAVDSVDNTLKASSGEVKTLNASSGEISSSANNNTLKASGGEGKDWRGTPFLGPVKNQLACGGCWSFSSTAVLQSAWAVKSGKLETFSEQQLIDCVNNGESTCDLGGIIAESWDYVLGGARPMTEETYPYTATSGAGCKYDAAKASEATYSSHVSVPEGDEAALAHALDTVPAIAVAIDASTQDFQLYKSGVFTSDKCGNDWENLDHAVTVVGYGTDSTTGQDYWIVQNSWDVTYGEEGYIRMARNHNNMCGVAKDASYVLA
jgi:cathepsin L